MFLQETVFCLWGKSQNKIESILIPATQVLLLLPHTEPCWFYLSNRHNLFEPSQFALDLVRFQCQMYHYLKFKGNGRKKILYDIIIKDYQSCMQFYNFTTCRHCCSRYLFCLRVMEYAGFLNGKRCNISQLSHHSLSDSGHEVKWNTKISRGQLFQTIMRQICDNKL